jgi:hypothetical protein
MSGRTTPPSCRTAIRSAMFFSRARCPASVGEQQLSYSGGSVGTSMLWVRQ